MSEDVKVTLADNDCTLELTEWLVAHGLFDEEDDASLIDAFGRYADQAFARHRTAAQPEREAVLEEAARQALLQIEKYAEFFCEEDFDPLVDQLRAALTTPAPAVSRVDEIVAEEMVEAVVDAANIVSHDGYYEIDKEAAWKAARAILSRIRGEQ